MEARLSSTIRLLATAAMLVLLLPAGSTSSAFQILQPSPAIALPQHPSAATASGGLLFVENVGQLDQRARFQAMGGQGAVHLAEDGIWLTLLEKPTDSQPSLAPFVEPRPLAQGIGEAESGMEQTVRGVNLHLSYSSANPQPRLEGFNRQRTRVSYFLGNDSSKWYPEVPVWGGVRYVDIYPGVDLEISGEAGQISQRFVVRSLDQGLAALKTARLVVEGAEGMATEAAGLLHIATAIGSVAVQLARVETTSPAGAGDLVPLPWDAKPAAEDGDEVAFPFNVATDAPILRINPAVPAAASSLLYSTFWGASDKDRGWGIQIDASGNTFIVGATQSASFTTTVGAYQKTFGGGTCTVSSFTQPCPDVFVTKFGPSGAPEYSTFLGGDNDDQGLAVALDGQGRVYVTGSTRSSNFPLSGGFDISPNGSGDVFVTQLSATGWLLYSTLIGGSDVEAGRSVALGSDGAVYIAGYTQSSDFPATAGAYQTAFGGGTCSYRQETYPCPEVFVASLNLQDNSLSYATYLGGASGDYGNSLAVDGAGNVYVTGQTGSAGFPTTAGAFDTTFGGGTCGYPTTYPCYDAFVAKLNPQGTGLVYSSFLGGSGEDVGFGIAVDGEGYAYVGGGTDSTNFPTSPTAYQKTPAGYADIFVAKLSPQGSALTYGTYIGGSAIDHILGLRIDAQGDVYATGLTQSKDNFPTTLGAFQNKGGDSYGDAFVIRLRPSDSTLVYSTYLGGTSWDQGRSLAIDTVGSVYVTGFATSTNFPTSPGAFQGSFGGMEDAFISRLAIEPLDFTLSAMPTGRSLEPGEVTTITLTAQPIRGFADTVALSVSTPPPSVTLSLSPLSLAPAATATLTITDTHTGPLKPGLGYTVVVTGTGGGLTHTVSVGLVIGGSKLFLPATLRNY